MGAARAMLAALALSFVFGCGEDTRGPALASGAVDGVGVVTPEPGLALVVSEVDPSAGRVRLVNRDDIPYGAESIEVWSSAGGASVRGPVAPFASVSVSVTLDAQRDFVLVIVDGRALQLVQYGSAFDPLELGGSLWQGAPIDAPSAASAVLVPANAQFDLVPHDASAYRWTISEPSSVAGVVTDETGAAIAEATVDVTCGDDARWGGAALVASTTSNASGLFGVTMIETHSMCWLRAQAPGHIGNLRPFIASGARADVGPVQLKRFGGTPGTRVSAGRINFGTRVFLEADAADLAGVDDLVLSFLDAHTAARRTLTPLLSVGAVDVRRSSRPNEHVVFRSGRAMLHIGADVPTSAFPVGVGAVVYSTHELDVARSPIDGFAPSGLVVVGPNGIDLFVDHFSAHTLFQNDSWMLIAGPERLASEEHPVNPVCLCSPTGEASCAFSTDTYTRNDTTMLSGSQSLERALTRELGATLGGTLGGGEGAPGEISAELSAKIAEELRTALSGAFETSRQTGQEFTCTVPTTAPLPCHDVHGAYLLVRESRDITLWMRRVVRVNYMNEAYLRQNLPLQVIEAGFGLVEMVLEGNSFGYYHSFFFDDNVEVDVVELSRAESITLTSPTSCAEHVFRYSANPDCGCDAVTDGTTGATALTLGENGVTMPAPPMCPGSGFITSSSMRTFSDDVVLSGAAVRGLSDDAILASVRATVCTSHARAMTMLCDQAALGVGADQCDATCEAAGCGVARIPPTPALEKEWTCNPTLTIAGRRLDARSQLVSVTVHASMATTCRATAPCACERAAGDPPPVTAPMCPSGPTAPRRIGSTGRSPGLSPDGSYFVAVDGTFGETGTRTLRVGELCGTRTWSLALPGGAFVSGTPQIQDGVVVWADDRAARNAYRVMRWRYLDGATSDEIVSASSLVQTSPRVAPGVIAWVEDDATGRWIVVQADGAAARRISIASLPGFVDVHYAASAGRVAWLDDATLWIADAPSWTARAVSLSRPLSVPNAIAMDGTLVAISDFEASTGRFEIFVADLGTGAVAIVPPGAGARVGPAISGTRLAFEELIGAFGPDSRIVVIDLASAASAIDLTAGAGGAYHDAAIAGHQVIWQVGTGGIETASF